MWRALFLAIGLFCCLLGLECMVIDRAVLTAGSSESGVSATREVVPPEWAPWSLISGGAIVMLYSFTIPRRIAG